MESSVAYQETEPRRRGRPPSDNPKPPTKLQILKRALDAGEFSNENPDDKVQQLIDETLVLFEEKAKVLESLQDNRVWGSMMIDKGWGSEYQRAWIAAYLPRKTQEGNGESESDIDTDDDTDDSDMAA